MIIECSQCHTRFRLADERIKPQGVKVRCSKCKNVFTVTPPPPEPEEIDFGSFNMEPVAEEDPSGEDTSGTEAPFAPSFPEGRERVVGTDVTGGDDQERDLFNAARPSEDDTDFGSFDEGADDKEPGFDLGLGLDFGKDTEEEDPGFDFDKVTDEEDKGFDFATGTEDEEKSDWSFETNDDATFAFDSEDTQNSSFAFDEQEDSAGPVEYAFQDNENTEFGELEMAGESPLEKEARAWDMDGPSGDGEFGFDDGAGDNPEVDEFDFGGRDFEDEVSGQALTTSEMQTDRLSPLMRIRRTRN